jgi:hypothetical protein
VILHVNYFDFSNDLTLLLFDCKQIKWENRFEGNTRERCLVTVDGIDFAIQEPTNFSSRWFSHKFGGPGLRYEIAVCIHTGKIVSFNGPFECGSWPDLKIFRSRLKQNLTVGEKVVADRGYNGDERICTPDSSLSNQHKAAMNTARARHETINGRLKTWGILKNVFRHHRDKHHFAFRSVLVLVQIEIEYGHPPFQVDNLRDPII